MQSRRDRFWRIALMVCGLAALLVLAASLSTSTLGTDWTAMDFWNSSAGSSASGSGLRRSSKIIIVASLILLLTLVAANILLASRRRWPMSRMSFSLFGMMLTLLIIAMLRPDILQRLQLSPPAADTSAATSASAANAPPVPAVLPVALAYVVSLAAAGLAILLVWMTWRLVRRPQLRSEDRVARQAAQAAQTALADWQSGSPLADVIIRCYREMSELVAEKRSVQRAAHMTPREFVRRLEKAGVPAQPTQQLTALFELARYSPQPLGAPEEAAARACLKALAEALENAA
jgi:hypothetical protein